MASQHRRLARMRSWIAHSASVCGLGDYRTPDLSQRESESRSVPTKSFYLGLIVAVPVKNANYPSPPRNRNNGLVGPLLPQPIVNYKFMTSTLQEGYFVLPMLGTLLSLSGPRTSGRS